MIKICQRGSETHIAMTRGDTLKLSLTLVLSDGSEYVPAAEDAIRFAAKRNYKDRNVLITKTIPVATMILELEPTDTSSLRFGDYVFDMQITYADGTVDTFVSGTLTLMEEVV